MNWKAAVLLTAFLPGLLCAQPHIDTQLLNGVTRAVVWHSATGLPVTDDMPAQPGETLQIQGSGFGSDVQILVRDKAVDTTPLDDVTATFSIPPDAGSSFLAITAINSVGTGNTATIPVDAPFDAIQLSSSEVRTLVTSAAQAVAGEKLAIVVSDRAGDVLAVYRRSQTQDADVEKALSLARTGAFFSDQQTPLTSRTVRAISRVNFPEGIPNQAAGALYGIENTNRGCDFNIQYLPGQSFPRQLNAAGSGYSLGIATVPGGIPIFRNGVTVVGGMGVAGLSDDADEYAAVVGAASNGFFVRLPLPDPGAVYLAGFQLPAVKSGVPPDVQPASSPGGFFQVEPRNGSPAPEGWLFGPAGSAELSAADVAGIVQNAINTANLTRAAIRLPVGERAKMVISVSDLSGNLLALYRMRDSTIFSVDVALTKARNVVYFSGLDRDPRDLPGVPLGTAVTNRTIGFGSQVFFPSGIYNSKPGPFYEMYLNDVASPCSQAHQPANPNQSGIVFFPGSAPLYRQGRMVGGLGVSGDGVEQDDFVTAGGARGYEAPAGARADQILIRQVRLPYLKFPRNPEQ